MPTQPARAVLSSPRPLTWPSFKRVLRSEATFAAGFLTNVRAGALPTRPARAVLGDTAALAMATLAESAQFSKRTRSKVMLNALL